MAPATKGRGSGELRPWASFKQIIFLKSGMVTWFTVNITFEGWISGRLRPPSLVSFARRPPSLCRHRWIRLPLSRVSVLSRGVHMRVVVPGRKSGDPAGSGRVSERLAGWAGARRQSSGRPHGLGTGPGSGAGQAAGEWGTGEQ